MNRTLLKRCLFAIAACFAISLTLFHMTELKEPVFLEHYYELMIYDEQYIELSYITNGHDNAEVYNVIFPELEGTGAFVDYCEMTSYSGYTNGRHKMQTVRVRIICKPSEFTDDIVLENAELLLSSGRTIVGNIGKIVLFPYKMDDNIKFVETRMSSSSNTGVSFSDARFLDDVSINSLPFALRSETDGILKLFVNNISESDIPLLTNGSLKMASGERFDSVELFTFAENSRIIDELSLPFRFYEGEYLLLVGEFTIDSSDSRKYNRYDIHRRIYLENTRGEIDYHVLYNMNYQPYFEGMDFYEFLEHKGAK